MYVNFYVLKFRFNFYFIWDILDVIILVFLYCFYSIDDKNQIKGLMEFRIIFIYLNVRRSNIGKKEI